MKLCESRHKTATYKDKLDIWDNADTYKDYPCQYCGKERKTKQPYEALDVICWKCFNKISHTKMWNIDPSQECNEECEAFEYD